MANNYEQIMALVNAGNKMGLSNTITRDNGIPLDLSSVQESYNDAVVYAATKAIAYHGQILSADGVVYQIVAESQGTVNIDGTNYEIYIKPVGVAPQGDDASISVTADGLVSIFGYSAAQDGTLPVRENGALVWKTLEAIGAGDGNDNTTYEFALNEAGNGLVITPKFNGQAIEEDGETVVYELALDVYTKAEADAKYALKSELYDDSALTAKIEAVENKVDTGDQTVSAYVAAQISAAEAGKLTKVLADSADVANNKVTVNGEETTPVENVIYLVKDNAVSEGDVYKEYMVIGGALVQTGDTSTDLSDYAKTADVNSALALKYDISAHEAYAATITEALAGKVDNSALDSYYTSEQVDEKVNVKANAADVYAKSETYSQAEVNKLIQTVSGDSSESAASVKRTLDTYIAATDAEIYGSTVVEGWKDEEGNYNPSYSTATSRIDALETLAANNTTLAQKGVDDAAAVKAIADTNTSDIEALEDSVTNVNTSVAKNAEDIVTANAKITALENADATINDTIAGQATSIADIKVKDEAQDALIDSNTKAIATKADSSALTALSDKIGEIPEEKTIIELINDSKYDDTTVKDLITAEQTRAEAAEKVNADAIAALVGEDSGKTARAIAKEEVAAIVGSAPEAFDTLEEIAAWITNDQTGAAALSNKVAAHSTMLNGIGENGQPATVIEAINSAIDNIDEYELGVATTNALGGVKASTEIGVAEDGTMSVTSLSMDKLVQGENTLILNGGSAL